MTFDLALLRKDEVTASEIFPKISTRNYTEISLTQDYTQWLTCIYSSRAAENEKKALKEKLKEIYDNIPVIKSQNELFAKMIQANKPQERPEPYVSDSESSDSESSGSSDLYSIGSDNGNDNFDKDGLNLGSNSDQDSIGSTPQNEYETDKEKDKDYFTCSDNEHDLDQKNNQPKEKTTLVNEAPPASTTNLEETTEQIIFPDSKQPKSLVTFFANPSHRTAQVIKHVNLADFPNTLIAACVIAWPEIEANIRKTNQDPLGCIFTDFNKAMDSAEVSSAQDGTLIFETLITSLLIAALVITVVSAVPLPIVVTVAVGLFFFICMDVYSLGNRYSIESQADEIKTNFGGHLNFFPSTTDTNGTPANTNTPDNIPPNNQSPS